jgi:hypothetical protein
MATDGGLFEATSGGALGAMQSFRDRMIRSASLGVGPDVRHRRKGGS